MWWKGPVVSGGTKDAFLPLELLWPVQE